MDCAILEAGRGQTGIFFFSLGGEGLVVVKTGESFGFQLKEGDHDCT